MSRGQNSLGRKGSAIRHVIATEDIAPVFLPKEIRGQACNKKAQE